MALPSNEISMIVALCIVVLWMYFKFFKHKMKPNPEDVVDLITLLLLGPVITIGSFFVLTSFNVIGLEELSVLRVNLGISGAILIGTAIYIFYVLAHKRMKEKKTVKRV